MQNEKLRFTLAGVPELDRSLEDALSGIAGDIAEIPSADAICSVLLGGGYGRGEGGAFRNSEGEMTLYNDLDFFVILKDSANGKCRIVNEELKHISEKWSSRLKIDVDFGPARTVSSLAKVRDTMMYQELKAGYHPVYGPEDAMRFLPEADFSRIPCSEAMRLMLNRGAGLLFAEEKLRTGKSDRELLDFISRNIWKSVLGCGDAVLICGGQYSAGVEIRLGLLKERSGESDPGLAAFYERAVAFKRYPQLEPIPVLEDLWKKAVVLWLDTLQRLLFGEHAREKTPQEIYRKIVSSSSCRDGHFLRNFLLNCDAWRRGMPPRGFLIHPRYHLLAELFWMLFEKTVQRTYIMSNVSLLRYDTWLKLWNRFN